jgi:hypothetical protein
VRQQGKSIPFITREGDPAKTYYRQEDKLREKKGGIRRRP